MKHFIKRLGGYGSVALLLCLMSNTALALKPFDTFLQELTDTPNPVMQDQMIKDYLDDIVAQKGGLPLIEDANPNDGVADVIFLYREATADSDSVLLFGEFNGSSDLFGPRAFFMRDFFNEEAMTRFDIPGKPPLFYRKLTNIEDDARLNYKFITLPSFSFIFDPLNPEATPGGFGGDSVFKMPNYCAPKEFNYFEHIPHGVVLNADGEPLQPIAGSPIGGDPSIDPTNKNHVLAAVNPSILPMSLVSLFIDTPKRDQGYWVYLPPRYNPDKKGGYPVVYLLDGWDWISYANVNNIADYLIYKGFIEPVILVMHDQQFCIDSAGGAFSNGRPETNCFSNPLNSDADADPVNHTAARDTDNLFRAFVNPNTGELVETNQALIKDLIAEIDSRYNTRKNAKGRAIAGVSATAVPSLLFPLYHPGDIKKGIVLSGVHEITGWYCEYVNENLLGPAMERASVPDIYKLLCLTDGDVNTRDAALPLLPNKPNVSYYVGWGTYETPLYDIVDYGTGTQVPAVTQNQDLLDQLIARGNTVSSDHPNLGHSWGMWPKQFGDALRVMFPGKYAKWYQGRSREQMGLCE